MRGVHIAVGFGVVGGFFLLFAWGGLAFLLRRGPGAWFWRLLATVQGLLAVQLVAGLVLLALGYRLPSFLHLAYGALFPAIVLVVAHVLGRGMDDPDDAWKVFAVAAFVAFGLTLRALATGFGLG